MRDFTTEGIVLKKRRQGDFDYFIDIFTPQQGKITIIAKGALKPSSRFIGKLEIGQQGYFTIHKTQKEYLLLKQITCKPLGAVTPGNLHQMNILSELLDLTHRCQFAPSINAAIYSVLTIGVTYCQIIPEIAQIHTKLHFLKLLGSETNSTICHVCEKEAQEQESFHYTSHGEILCQSCGTVHEHKAGELQFNHLKVIKFLLDNVASPMLLKLRLPENILADINEYTSIIFEHHYGVKTLSQKQKYART